MNDFWNVKSIYKDFKLFSIAHVITIFLILAVIILNYITRNIIKSRKKVDKCIRVIMVLLMMSAEVSSYYWAITSGTFDLGSSLPLTLCGMNVYLAFILLFNKSYVLYELLFFMGLLGSLQAVLTPDVKYNFPHIRYIQFFVTHGCVLITIFYMTFIYNFKPKVISVIKAYLALVLYSIPVGIFNILVDGNYLFLVHKPESASLLDYFGPWPWYILVMLMLLLPYFFLVYFLFYVKEFIWKIKCKD